MTPASGTRVLVVGLDGASFRFIRPLLQQDRLPNLARVIQEGVSGGLESTCPPVSAPAWVSFMTGQNPGRHGVFDFENYDATSYTCRTGRLVDSSYFAGTTFFDAMSSLGYRVGLVTVPLTYPPWEVNGFMIAGEPTPDQRKPYTYPPELSGELDALADHTGTAFQRMGVEEMVPHLDYELERRTSVAIKMMEREPWDFFMIVQNVLDAAHHRLWKFWDPASPVYVDAERQKYGHLIHRYYEMIDAALGSLLDRLDKDTVTFILSDHGGSLRAPKKFLANVWLRDQGLLAVRASQSRSGQRGLYQSYLAARDRLPPDWRRFLRRRLPSKVRSEIRQWTLNLGGVDWSGTYAYQFPMYQPFVGLVINLRGRQPSGLVEPAQYEKIREELMARALDLRDPQSHEAIVERAYRREEIYRGPYSDRAPDVIIRLKPGYGGGQGFDDHFIRPVPEKLLNEVSGGHDMEGILLASGPGIKRGATIQGANLMDLAPTILYTMGVPIPRTVDGRILEDIFEPSFLGHHPVQYADTVRSASSPHTLSSEEEQAMRDKLRGLGYL